MNALTICQPYAHLIAIGEKRVENRTWYTRYRGPLAIHAGKSRDWLDLDPETNIDGCGIPLDEMAFGAIIAITEVIDCLPIERIRRGEFDEKYSWLKNHLHTEGPFCWILGKVLQFAKPIPAKGMQQIWSWTPPTTGPDPLILYYDSKGGPVKSLKEI